MNPVLCSKADALKHIKDHARVLDVGGASKPLGRADWIIDVLPFREYRLAETHDNIKPHFDITRWIQRDVCDKEPWPFEDNYFDFAFCSHLLEDIRDPVWVCQELSRVARAGYVEVPSRAMESTRGIELRWELPMQAGCYHHRWLCEFLDGKIVFLMKPAFMHCSRQYSFPRRYLNRWTDKEQATLGVFWEESLPAQENIMKDFRMFQKDMKKYIRNHMGYTFHMWFHDHVFLNLKQWFWFAQRNYDKGDLP